MPLPVEIPISKHFSADRIAEIKGYVGERTDALIRGLQEIRERKITTWRRIYAGTPREKTKSFPWQNACFTLDTEALTINGWKPIGEITTNDSVYSMGVSGKAGFFPVVEVTKYKVHQLVHFEGKSIDLRVTRNHNMLVQGENKKRHFVPAEHFLCHGTTGFDIPLTSETCLSYDPQGLFGIPTKPLLRFLGWYLSEGNFIVAKGKAKRNPGGDIYSSFSIAQKPGAKRETLKADLRDCGFSFKEHKTCITVHAKTMPQLLKDCLRKLGNKYEKFIPDWGKYLSQENALCILDRLILGDGNTSKVNGAQSYFSSSKRLADDVQELCQYAGLRATMTVRVANGQGGIVEGGRQIKQKHDLYCLQINRKSLVQCAKLKRWLEEIPGGIETACVQTSPHHTVYVRRNGKAVWCGNSNLVPQIVGSFCDQLTAKIIMGIFGIDPLWVTSVEGEFDRKEDAEAQRVAVEQWMAYAGMEPGHLNLLPKYTIWVRTMVKYGLGAIKLLPERTVEKVAAYPNSRSVVFTDFVRHEGPVALPLLFEDFLIPPMTSDLERAPIVAQRAKLNKFDLENLKHDPTYNKADIEEILKSPDRGGPEKSEQDIENETGVREDQGPLSEQWDLYEDYFPYTVAGEKFQLIATYHKGTMKMPKCVFNWLPDNSIPYHAARLGSDGERSYGFGFCEMLKDYQEEVAAIHNQRRDAATLSNTNLLRVDPGTQLDSQFAIYPNALLPAAEGQVEIIPMGRDAASTIQDEQMVLQEATDRAGIGPSSSGSGSGSVNKKGVYSAMGSFQVMQEGNTRANLNITEFRQSHYMFGRQALLYWSHFGVPDKDIKALAKQGPVLEKALDNYKKGRIILPIRAASGSVNKEIEKQNLMLLLNNMRAHWQQISQMMQATANPMMPPNYKDYLLQVILASQILMKKIVRDFSIPDPSAILPEPMGIKEELESNEQKAKQQKQMQQMQQAMQQLGPQQAQPGSPPQLPAGQPQQTPETVMQ